MRDYHFDNQLSRSSRPTRRWPLWLGVLAITTAIAAVWLTRPATDKPTPQRALATAPVASAISTPLALPGQKHPAETKPPAPSTPESTAKPSLLTPPLLAATVAAIQQPEPDSIGAPAAPAKPQRAPEPEPKPDWLRHKIRQGDSLASIFKTLGLSPSVLHRIVTSSKLAASLARIKPGQELRLLRNDDGELQELVFQQSQIDSLHILAEENGFRAEQRHKAVETRTASLSGTIQSSLFLDGHKAGLTDAQIMELAALFGWDIDFALEIRAGDQFRVIFQEEYLDGEKFRNGPILAAEFVNHGKTYQAFRFQQGNNVGYFDAEGRNKRRAFIRTPIKFARISSRFTLKRWHPVLKKWRSHKGVDYAAPSGTPIKATGSGKVIFRGWKGGYGRVVIIQHASKYQTLYAHMSKFAAKVKAGRKVKQGQIVGYVGKSGLATGPHLHYEFRVNGVHRNPLTVKLPKSLPLPKTRLAAFKTQTQPLVTQLAALARQTLVASNR